MEANESLPKPEQPMPRHLDNANQEAASAAKFGYNGRFYRDKYFDYRRSLDESRTILNGEPVVFFTVFFVVCLVVDMMVGWELYQYALASVFASPPTWAVFLVGMVINGWAAMTSHWLSLVYSRALFDWEVQRHFNAQRDTDTIREFSVRVIQQQRQRYLWFFILSLLALVAVVGFLSYARYDFLRSQQSEQSMLEILILLLPLIITVVEVFFGMYLWYFFVMTADRIGAWLNRRSYLKNRDNCYAHDKVAAELLDRAFPNVADVMTKMQKDLKDSYLRVSTRSLDDHYLDEWQYRQAIFEVRDGATKAPIFNIRVVGFTKNRAVSSAFFTNDDGIAVVFWQGAEMLQTVGVGDTFFPGPFAQNLTHVLWMGTPPIIPDTLKAPLEA